MTGPEAMIGQAGLSDPSMTSSHGAVIANIFEGSRLIRGLPKLRRPVETGVLNEAGIRER